VTRIKKRNQRTLARTFKERHIAALELTREL
jgi:hypothetical protein